MIKIKGEQIIKKEVIRPLTGGVYYGFISCEIWKQYRWSAILQIESDVKYISYVTKFDNKNMPVMGLGEKIGKSFNEVKEWTIIKFPEFKEVL